jgi:hypothetical protein
MLVDLNSGSGFVYGARSAVCDTGVRINALIDGALEAEYRSKPPRDYLGGSRIGEPCARRLAYEVTLAPLDVGQDFDGRLLRIFDAGHHFEDLTIRWLQAARFDVRTRGRDGRQYGFSVAGGRLRGHIDGAIVAAPTSALSGLLCSSTRRSSRARGPIWSSGGSGRPSRSTSRSASSTWPTCSSRLPCSPP